MRIHLWLPERTWIVIFYFFIKSASQNSWQLFNIHVTHLKICMFKQDILSWRHLYYTDLFCLIEIRNQKPVYKQRVFTCSSLCSGSLHRSVCCSQPNKESMTWIQFSGQDGDQLVLTRPIHWISFLWSFLTRACWIGTEDSAQQAKFPLCGMLNQLTQVSRPQRCSSTLFLLNKHFIFCMQKWTIDWFTLFNWVT